jgi:hypothetical protein
MATNEKPLRKFWYYWTYIGNYSEGVREATATEPSEVIRNLHNIYSEDFRKKACIYVFDVPPVAKHAPR